MTSTAPPLLARLGFVGLIGLAGGVAGSAFAAPGPGDIKLGPTVPTTVKPSPLHDDPDLPLANPTDPCKTTHGTPKGLPQARPVRADSGRPREVPRTRPLLRRRCDRPVPGKPSFTG